jgi:hypothetical protein
MLMQGKRDDAVVALHDLLVDRQEVLGETHPDIERTRQLLDRAQAGEATPVWDE